MQFSKSLSWQGGVVICWNLDPYKRLERENGWLPPKKRRWTDLRNHAFFSWSGGLFLRFILTLSPFRDSKRISVDDFDSLHRKRRNTDFRGSFQLSHRVATKTLPQETGFCFLTFKSQDLKTQKCTANSCFQCRLKQSSCFVYQTIGNTLSRSVGKLPSSHAFEL